jgi:hypothetical protein
MGVNHSRPLGDCDWHGCHNAQEIAEALKDPVHPGSVEVMSLLQSGHPAPYLPYGGDLKTWNEMNVADKTIHTLPIEQQAQYADMVVRAVAHQPDDVMYYKILGGDSEIPVGANCTAVGAIAYTALYAVNEGVRNHARLLHDNYMAAMSGK